MPMSKVDQMQCDFITIVVDLNIPNLGVYCRKRRDRRSIVAYPQRSIREPRLQLGNENCGNHFGFLVIGVNENLQSIYTTSELVFSIRSTRSFMMMLRSKSLGV